MASIVSNDVETEIVHSVTPDNEIQNTSTTKDPATSFIDKHIHPPSAVPGYVGMPTNDTRTQVVTNWVSLNSSVTPSAPDAFGLPPVPANPGQIDGFAILHTSGIRHQNIQFFRSNEEGFQGWNQDVANTRRLNVYDTNRFQYDATKFRAAYRSTTVTLNATAFNDIGILSTAQFNPPLLFAGTIYNLAEVHPKKFKKFIEAYIRAHKLVGISKKHLDDFHRDHQAVLLKLLQVDPPPIIRRNGDYEEVVEQPKLDPNTSIQFISFGKQGNLESGNTSGAIVPTHEQVLNLSARAYGGAAKDGNFVVQRINCIDPKWMTAANDNATTNINRGMYECYYAFEDLLGNDNFKPFTEIDFSGINCRVLIDVQWSDDITWAWTLVTGLVPNTNIGNGAINADLLVTKTYMGTEIQPAASSAWAGMQQPSPRPNGAAMQALMEAYYDLKDGMPAKYNFAGLAKVAGFAARKLGGAIVSRFVGSNKRSKPKKRQQPAKQRARSRGRRDQSWGPPPPRSRTVSRDYGNGRWARQRDYFDEGQRVRNWDWQPEPPQPPQRRRRGRSQRRPRNGTRTFVNSNIRKVERELNQVQAQLGAAKI